MTHPTTNVERGVQIAMAIVASLGTILLGLGQQSVEAVLLPALAILASVGSVVLTDITGKFRLNRTIANLAALLAVTYAVSHFFDRGSSELRLLAVANLLVYLQMILQFQEKSLRVYWSLSVLSLLQVVVASALNLSVTFGPLLVVYLAVALTAMCLLFVLRETHRFQPQDEVRHDKAPPPSPVAIAGRRRWPLAGFEVNWSGAGGEDLARPLLGRRLARCVAAMVFLTLIVTTLIFFGVPRYGREAWQSPTSRTSMVGFSEQVSLGQMGRILQSDDPVMRVRFLDTQTGRPLEISGDPYLRGAVLTHYISESSRYTEWKYYGLDDDRYPDPFAPLPTATPATGRVTQEIILDAPVDSSIPGYAILFTTWPVYQDDEISHTLKQNPLSRQVLIENTNASRMGQLTYSLRSGAFRGRTQSRLSGEQGSYVVPTPVANLTARQRERLPQLVALADQIVQDVGAATPLAKALALEAHFRASGAYTYDLNPNVERSPDLDPIEDFITNHKTGHCEYFASALVLMLRSQNIPARMVIGYKGGEYNRVGSYYQFRQKHAHAWAEAYLGPGDFPKDQVSEGGSGAAWLRLDPTPGDDELDADLGAAGLLAQIGDGVDYVQILWNDYVLGLNSDRQRLSIYGPIAEWFTRLWASLVPNQSRVFGFVLALLTAMLLTVSGIFLYWTIARGRHGGGMLLAAFLQILLAPLGWLKIDGLKSWLARRSSAPGGRPQVRVDFYQRLEELLARYGLIRTPDQTQREYAAAAGGRLADEPRLQSVAGVPRRIVDAFYRVRFGGATLDSAEQQTVEQAIAELESALAAHSTPPSPSRG